ncbi:MAG TPA: ferric reductase-like transmembrane domain-containing protein [Candidatus Limnocylindrales bacterium]
MDPNRKQTTVPELASARPTADPYAWGVTPRLESQLLPRPVTPTPPSAVPSRPARRPQARPTNVYRGLPRPIRLVGWVALAIGVGIVLGATGPTALRRIGAVAALQPGMLAWYSVRALGFLAYIALACSVLYGLLLSTKILDAIAHRPVSFALHKDLAIVAMILAALHGALLIFDASFPFTALAILVPFQSPYAPVTVGIGQITFYLSLVVTASFYVRRHIGQRAWRMLHYLTFLSFIGATFHGLMSGSDSGQRWAFYLYVGTVATAVFLLSYRIAISLAARRHRPAAVPGGVATAQIRPRGPLDRPGAASVAESGSRAG